MSDDLGDLASIFDPRLNVCVVRRRHGVPSVDMSATHGEHWRSFGRADEALASGLPSLDEDLRLLVEVLIDLTGAAEVGVRARRTPSPMCPQFHVDHVPLRLVCTYWGPGTDWLDESTPETAVRSRSNVRLGRVRSAHRGDLVLLKGESWPGNEGRGAVHRSPAHTSDRLVVSLDPL